MKRLLFRGKHLVVIGQDAPSKAVFVTFNEMGTRAGGGRFWGDKLFSETSVAAVGVVTTIPNWYPLGEMEQALPAILAFVRNRQVFTYGHSQGGYGAIKFGRRLGSAAAIAFCPQFSIDPQVVGAFDSRFAKYFDRALNNGAPIYADDVCDVNYVVFDPFCKLDALNVEEIIKAKASAFSIVPAFFTGHHTIKLISEGRFGADLIRMFTKATLPGARELRAVIRVLRKSSSTYRIDRMEQLLRRSRKGARFMHFMRAASMPDVPAARPVWEVLLAVAQGQFALAQETLATWTDKDCRLVHPLVLWGFFRRTKFKEGELRVADTMTRLYSGNVYVRLQSANSYVTHGLRERAMEELDHIASSMNVPDPRYLAQIRDYCRRIGHAAPLEHLLAYQKNLPEGEVRAVEHALADIQALLRLEGQDDRQDSGRRRQARE